jgi:hypothetical protein
MAVDAVDDDNCVVDWNRGRGEAAEGGEAVAVRVRRLTHTSRVRL